MPRPNVERERRDQILQAACQTIAERGFRDVRIADVARRAGVSSGMVHYYFDTKDALLHAAFEYNFQDSLARRRWIMEEVKDPLPRLLQLVESYLPADPATTTAWRVWVELWAAALNNPALQQLNDTVYGEWRDIVGATVRAGIAGGSLRAADPDDATDMLVGLLDGLAIQVLTQSTHLTRERMRATCERFIETLAPSS
ncbi:TetR/AcrR family transcriptional regulator [Mycobacterium sp. 3519A]|uniref:TetR/AcrR family transcriptional regulator n=1 Tax=Mycobacterium sp. 3519A TaxID=2057184 RepID=UPI000C7C741D|nr:TetR/AcrR family transcriptional regulator [Mycobacterium sp. 3519A]